MATRDRRPAPEHIPPRRDPVYGFGRRLRRGDFVGYVDTIYADYWAAVDAMIVPENWFSIQEDPPSTRGQIFYGLVALDGKGAILAGELDTTLDEA